MLAALSSSGLGYWVLIPDTGVRIPTGSQTEGSHNAKRCQALLTNRQIGQALLIL